MNKVLSALFFVLIFSLNLHADDGNPPSHWMESEDTINLRDRKQTFLDESRLKCVSYGYEKATGETPSLQYLAALSMRMRVDGKKDNRSIKLTKDDDVSYSQLDDLRKDYLGNVAQQIAMSGACVDEDIAGKISNSDYANLIRVIDHPDTLLVKNGEYNANTLNKLSQKITDWDYISLRQLFPMRTDDNKLFTSLSYEEKQTLLKESYARDFDTNPGLADSLKKTRTTGKFVNCYNQIEKNRNAGTIETAKGRIVKPVDICHSIKATCGYSSDAGFCGGFPEVAAAPVAAPKKTTGGCPKPLTNPCKSTR